MFLCAGGRPAALKRSSSGQSVPITQPAAAEASGNVQNTLLFVPAVFTSLLQHFFHILKDRERGTHFQAHLDSKTDFRGEHKSLSSCVLFLGEKDVFWNKKYPVFAMHTGQGKHSRTVYLLADQESVVALYLKM